MVSFRNEMVGSNNNRVEDVTAGGQRLGCEYWHLFQWCNSGPVDMSNKIIYEMWCVACWCSTQLTLSLFLAELHRPSEKRLWCPPFLLLLNHSVVFHHPDGINPPVKAINGRGDWKSIHHLENPNRGKTKHKNKIARSHWDIYNYDISQPSTLKKNKVPPPIWPLTLYKSVGHTIIAIQSWRVPGLRLWPYWKLYFLFGAGVESEQSNACVQHFHSVRFNYTTR